MDLASKDAYIQNLTSKVLQREREPKKRPFVQFKGQTDAGPSKKKKKCKKKISKEKDNEEKKQTPKPQKKPSPAPAAQKGSAAQVVNGSKADVVNGRGSTQTPKGGNIKPNFSTVDVLRKRLHEKIEEARGQGAPKDAASEAVQAKRAKRKLERERKKRKKKEFRMKKLAEASGQEPPPPQQQPQVKQEEEKAPAANKRDETAIVFNKVDTVEEEYMDKMLKKKKKKERVKGKVTPLTGKNYKQLLSRVEARKAKLEELREKDEDKAKEMEEKIKWTNMLYKAEGIKIKDDEGMLRTALRRKEKRQAQRKKNWGKRSENIVEKMQKRQDKRRRNLQKRKNVKLDKKKERARKKGRVLPEDLKKAAV